MKTDEVALTSNEHFARAVQTKLMEAGWTLNLGAVIAVLETSDKLIADAREVGKRARLSDETGARPMPDGLFIHQQGMGWAVNASYLREADARALYDALSGSLKANSQSQETPHGT